MSGHKHNYVAVRVVTKKVGKRTVTYTFLECANPGCPQPNKMETK